MERTNNSTFIASHFSTTGSRTTVQQNTIHSFQAHMENLPRIDHVIGNKTKYAECAKYVPQQN